MTSKLTREENVQAVFDLKAGYTLGLADVEILKRVARIALAEMDSEPVAWRWRWSDDVEGYWRYTEEQRETHGSVTAQPLYRHAQPAQVVMDEAQSRAAFEQWCTVNIERNKWHPEFYAHLPAREQWAAWEACRAAMLQSRSSIQPAPELDFEPNTAEARSGNSPVIPDSSVIGWLRTDYQRDFQVNCTAPQFVMGKNDPSSAWGVQYMPVTKAGGQQNSPQNIPEIIPQWIPVSERMPEDRMSVILWDAEIGEVTSGHYSHKTQTFYHCGDAIRNEITHWMPPPAAPQEPKP